MNSYRQGENDHWVDVLDAHYEEVRQSGQVCDAAVLKAIGVNAEGKREVLGVSVSLSEHEVHCGYLYLIL